MPYSEPTNLAVVACPGGESFANEVITHLRHMYKHRFSLKNDVISKRYSMDKGELVQQINLDNDLHTSDMCIRGQIDKYTWVDKGSSYLPSELNAAYLYAQLELANEITADRMNTWNMYYDAFEDLEKADVEECVLAWADATGTDFEDKLNDICYRIVELGIC